MTHIDALIVLWQADRVFDLVFLLGPLLCVLASFVIDHVALYFNDAYAYA